jgi:hypothetical protein
MNTIETQGARDLFASDYLLIADNDATAYGLLGKLAKVAGVVELSDTMREHYEQLCERVFDLMANKGAGFSEFERGLIMQLLAGWGSDVFDTIARELKARASE